MPSKRTKSVRVVNPRALSVNLDPKPIENVLPDPMKVAPKQLPASRQLAEGKGVRIVSKVERSR